MAKKQTLSGEERRRAKRTLVQESFNLFLVIPEIHGMVRIYMRDISRLGICFQSEVESPIKKGQELKTRLYINPGLYLPLDCRVVRVGNGEVALEFVDANAPPAKAVGFLQDFFETAATAGVLVE